MFTVGTLNVKTLKQDCDLMKLENAFVNSELKILGLSEIRRKNECLTITKNNNVFYHSPSEKG